MRLYDLATRTLAARPLKDPGESSLISGYPFSRLASPDGRYLFTLYIGSGGGAMVHELDLATASARCIDLPGDGRYDAAVTWSFALSHDGRTLWAVSAGYGRVVAIDVRAHRIRRAARFDATGAVEGNAGIAALSPNGRTLAVTDAQHLWFVDLQRLRARRGRPHVTVALGYSPDGRTLWAVGERSRVVALALRS